MNELNLIEEGGSVPVYEDALHFDATYSDKVDVGFNFVTGTRTVSFWVNPDATTFNGQPRQALCGQYGGSGQRTFYAEFRDTGVLRMYLPTSASGNSFDLIESNAGVYFNGGQWYYISVSLDAVSGGTMYVDGVAQTNTSPSATLGFTRSGAMFQWGNWSILTPAFNGKVKKLAVWNTARTQPEIVADMTRVWTGAETGLKAYFPTNEGSGNTIQDINSVYTSTITTTNPSPTYIDDFMWIREVVGSTVGSIEKSKIDLFDNQFVSVTKQSFDVNNLKQRLSGVTNNFTLPFTANNSNVFDYLDLNGNTSNKPYQLNYVEYIQDGTPIIKKGRLNLREISDAGYKVDVTHGINDFFDRIRDKYLYEPFDSRPNPFLIAAAASWYNSGNPMTKNAYGSVIPLANYVPSSVEIAEYQMSPYIDVMKAFEFIAEDVGYTFNDNTNGRLTNRLFGGGNLFDYNAEINEISRNTTINGVQSFVLNTFETNKKGRIFYTYSFQVEAFSASDVQIQTYIDGVLQPGSYGLSYPPGSTNTDYAGYFTTTDVYPRGTVIETIVSSTVPSSDYKISFGDYGHPHISSVGVVESSDMYFSNIFGDLTQLDFISYIFELFNLAFEVDAKNKNIEVYSLNDVYDPNLGNTIDLSDYFSNVVYKKFESNFGKVNNFKYKYLDNRPEKFNSSFVANNFNKDKTIIDSGLTASFHDKKIGDISLNLQLMSADGYDDTTLESSSKDVGFRVVNYNFYDSLGMFPADAIQIINALSFDYINYSGLINPTNLGLFVATNNNRLDWHSLIEDNYSSLRDYVLNRYQDVKVLMRVPRHLIDAFSFQNKIYISQLNSKFVVQSIKTRPDGLSEWILIKLN